MRWPFLVLALAAAGCSRQEAPQPPPVARKPPTEVVAGRLEGEAVTLPKQVGDWVRPDAPRRVTAETIFDYMDGGGELYLAYRFDHLSVFEYKASDASLGAILVELYRMKGSDDAFGLLSTDWGGEPADFAAAPAASPRASGAVPAHRGLYGAGLLRLWAGDLYVRILAPRETRESREAVLTLGREIARGASPGPVTVAPAIVAGVPAAIGGRQLRPDRTVFFRSYLVLNSAYFLASDDILGLGADVDAVTTEYRPAAAGERPIRVILVRYPTGERARSGVAAFTRAYVPEALESPSAPARGAAHVEHGWVAWARGASELAIALDAPSASVAQAVADGVAREAAPAGTAK